MTHSILSKKIKRLVTDECIFLTPQKAMEKLSKNFPFAEFRLVETRYDRDIKYAIDCFYEKKFFRVSVFKETLF